MNCCVRILTSASDTTNTSTKSIADHKKQEQLDSAPGKVNLLMCLLSLLSSIISFTIFWALPSNVTCYRFKLRHKNIKPIIIVLSLPSYIMYVCK